MARKYLSPSATAFVKTVLVFVEALFSLFNLASFPIRMLKVKHHVLLMVLASGYYIYKTWPMNTMNIAWLLAGLSVWILLSAALHLLHWYLNKKLTPKISKLINSPIGIPTNRFYKLENPA